MKVLGSLFFIVVVLVCAVSAQSRPIEGFSSFRSAFDVRYFLFHPDPQSRERSFFEINSNTNFSLLSLKQSLFLTFGIDLQTGMGHQSGPVLSDPRDTRYGLTSALELRDRDAFTLLGLEHVCFHDIDRDDGETQYWNKVFLQWGFTPAGSAGSSIMESRWSLRIGHYMETALGLASSSLVTGGNDFRNEVGADAEWAAASSRAWVLRLRWNSAFMTGDSGRIYYWLVPGFRLASRANPGFSIFADYHWAEKLPFRSKDELLEIGMRFAL